MFQDLVKDLFVPARGNTSVYIELQVFKCWTIITVVFELLDHFWLCWGMIHEFSILSDVKEAMYKVTDISLDEC